MRFHALTDNTSNHLPMHAANNFPYGVPPKLEDNEMDYGEPTESGLLSTLPPTPSGKAPPFLKGESLFFRKGRGGC